MDAFGKGVEEPFRATEGAKEEPFRATPDVSLRSSDCGDEDGDKGAATMEFRWA